MGSRIKAHILIHIPIPILTAMVPIEKTRVQVFMEEAAARDAARAEERKRRKKEKEEKWSEEKKQAMEGVNALQMTPPKSLVEKS